MLYQDYTYNNNNPITTKHIFVINANYKVKDNPIKNQEYEPWQ